MLKRHNRKRVNRVLFSVKSLFCIEQCYDAKNGAIYSAISEDISETFQTVKRFQNKISVIFWAAVSNCWNLPLKFIYKWIKINAKYYKQDILVTYLTCYMLHANRLYSKNKWIIEQNSEPSHQAISTQSCIHVIWLSIIIRVDWPLSSPDPNPLDYCNSVGVCVWGGF